MVTKSPLQGRPAKTFALQECLERGRRWSGCVADQRWKANDRGYGESQGERSHSFFYSNSERQCNPDALEQLIRIDIDRGNDVFRQRQFLEHLAHNRAQAQ